MARSNLIGNNRIDEISIQIKLAIVKAETGRDIPRAETIKHSTMSPANFYKAWRDPSLFRIGQLVSIYDYLKVPDEERRFT